MEKFYKCDRKSSVGIRLEHFWHKAQKAAHRAEDYAKKMGATSYIQPVQFFEGGVDFLEFEKEPDLRVWRKRTDLGETVVYEPRCSVRAGVMMVPYKDSVLSNRWNIVYEKNTSEWTQVRNRFPLSYWCGKLGIKVSSSETEDWKRVDAALKGKFWLPYLEFSAEYESASVVPTYVRKAVRAERLRLSLPVVSMDELYELLVFQLPDGKEEIKDFAQNLSTPTFFIYRDVFYISIGGECKHSELEEITKGVFVYNKNVALRESSLCDIE